MEKNLITISRLAKICGVHRMTVHQAAHEGRLVPAFIGGKLDLDHPEVQTYIIAHQGPKTTGRPRAQMPEGFTMDGGPLSAFERPLGGADASAPDADPTGPAAVAEGTQPGRRAMTPEALAAWIKKQPGKPRAYKLAEEFGITLGVARAVLGDLQATGGQVAEAAPADGAAARSGVTPSRGDSVDKFLDMSLRELRHSFGLPESMLTWLEIRRKAEDLRGREIVNNERLGSLISRDMVRTHIFGALEQLAQRLLTDTPQTLARRIYALAKAGAEPAEAQALVAELIGIQIKNTKQAMADNLARLKND
jgi:hypothetical protein